MDEGLDFTIDALDLPEIGDLLDIAQADAPARRVVTTGTRRTFKQLLQVANAAREIVALPAADEAVHIVMQGNFNCWDIVPAMLQLADEPAARLIVATLGFNRRNADELLRLLDSNKIRSVDFVCSVYFRDMNTNEFTHLADGLEARGHRIGAARSHAKVIGLQFDSGKTCTAETSANLRSCRNLEQLTLHGSPDVFNFHRQWIEQEAQRGRNDVK
jgi:hypothetical protein